MENILSILGVLLILGCDPFVTEFEDSSDAVMYEQTVNQMQPMIVARQSCDVEHSLRYRPISIFW